MGCTAGLIGINLAKQLLQFFNGVRHVGQVHQNSYALVVSTENLTQNCYMGNDHSKLLINCAFRIGGAAILLSNRPLDRHSSKYQLIHTVQTHMASSDRSYNCIFQEEDQDGLVGVTVTKDLLVTASKAIQSNISTLGPLVLPVSEQLLCFKSFNHFLPHVGAKPVLDELQRSLKLTEDDMEASRMTLYRFGNTSSSTVWYELAYVEAKGRIKYGDQVWHMAFGSGFKCTSVVWRAIRTVDLEVMNPWNDEIDEFPMDLNNIAPFNTSLNVQIDTISTNQWWEGW
ncbi:hypothetical protein HYC85_024935 [Camellia sinensis]|uniref:very-long-chain 3-oxoacyl-CoA synthase n=1 Tax=Camellia sinensis TaxID=4442 RepID=A0A7J7G9L3_CAMSI|nr:hypothetical protein HYC85_024935 [Camellia sinensis]